MPPNTKDKSVILTYMYHMCEKLAARLRRHDMQAQRFFIGWRSYGIGWLGEKCKLVVPSNDGKEFCQLGKQVLENVWSGQPVFQVRVTALDPQCKNMQPDLFASSSSKRQKLNMAIDEINRKFGEFAVAPAPLLNRSSMHNVIAPAWKPDGHRQTV
jgi:DNA polymerase IV